jgi:hypothetical protein
LKDQQPDQIDNTALYSIHEKNTNYDVLSCPSSMSNNMKWYVSELRINRPLIYRTQWTNGQQRSSNRKFSHSVNDLKQIYNTINHQENGKTRKSSDTAYSTLSLQNCYTQQQQFHHQSDDNILLHHFSCTDDDLNNLHSDEDNPYLSRMFELLE